MSRKEKIKSDFLDMYSKYDMEVIQDDGLNRHLRFRSKKDNFGWFDIVTWKGVLCINGDYGTYVFHRINDMFEFFRSPGEDLYINTGYWHEKVLAEDRIDGCLEFSIDMAHEVLFDLVNEYFDDISEHNELGTDEKKAECLKQVEEEILCWESEHEIREAVENFKFDEFQIHDFWECSLNQYTYRFIFNLYSISWAIKRYDEKNN